MLYKDWKSGINSIIKTIGVGINAEEIESWPTRLFLRSFSTKDLMVMVWKSSWEKHSLNKMKCVTSHDIMNVTNSINTHNHAKIIISHELRGDFQARLELKGAYKDIQLQKSDGKDKNFNCNPSSIGININIRQRYIITRIGSRLSFALADNGYIQNLKFENWEAAPQMGCFVAIAVPNGESVDIVNFTVSERK